MDNDKVIKTLNYLIETCKDGQEGFRQAAEKVDNLELKRFFNEEAMIRGRMAGDLEVEVIRLGSDPDHQGTIAGALHRTWMDLKGAFVSSDLSIISSVESGEDKAVNSYQKALQEPLPQFLRELIEQQFVSIKAVHDRVRDLRDDTKFKTRSV